MSKAAGPRIPLEEMGKASDSPQNMGCNATCSRLLGIPCALAQKTAAFLAFGPACCFYEFCFNYLFIAVF